MERRSMEARERLYRVGVASLSDAELLALILGTGSPGKSARQIAENLLCNCGGLKSLGQHYPQELCRIEGIGRARAAQILAALELSKRAHQQVDRRPRLKSPEDIYRHLAPSLSGLRKEVFHVLSFNSRQVLLQDSRVAEGTLNACPVDPREVFSAFRCWIISFWEVARSPRCWRAVNCRGRLRSCTLGARPAH